MPRSHSVSGVEKTTNTVFPRKELLLDRKVQFTKSDKTLNTYEIVSAQSSIKHNIFGANPVISGIYTNSNMTLVTFTIILNSI